MKAILALLLLCSACSGSGVGDLCSTDQDCGDPKLKCVGAPAAHDGGTPDLKYCVQPCGSGCEKPNFVCNENNFCVNI